MYRSPSRMLVSFLFCSVVLAACGGSYSSPASGGSGGTLSGSGMKLTTASSGYGTVLALSNGQTVYMFTADTTTSSACNSTCVTIWRPVAGGKVVGGAGVSGANLGSISRSDGSKQLTYNGHPLYTYVGDNSSGSVSGQNINSFGGHWYLVSPAGSRVTSKPTASVSGY